MELFKSIFLFFLAGLAEIGGGYLVWLWLREEKSIWLGLIGGIILFFYGIIPTLQSSPNFGRIYAAYGGVFVVMSILWGWTIDGKAPVMLQMKMEFPKLTVREYLGEENEKKKTVHR